MLAILLFILLFPVVGLMTATIVAGIDTFNEWVDEKAKESKIRKENVKIQKEREKLWYLYSSLNV